MPLRVTHVVLSLDVGGLERVVISLVREGVRLGQIVSVICLERPGKLASEVTSLGVRVISMNKPPGLTPQLVDQLRCVVREIGPDVIHCHHIAALLYAGRAARQENVPVIIHTEHTNSIALAMGKQRRLRMRMLWWFAARHTDRFCCVSQDIAVAAKRLITSKKLSVIANGIDSSLFSGRDDRGRIREKYGIPHDAPLVGTVGRLSEVKCQDLLIRALPQIRRHLAAHLLLVGDGPCRESLEWLVATLGLNDCVHFAGYQSRPQEFLQAMDVFALPSRTEGMPLSILEAWAGGLPVVASNVGGIPALVTDSHNGLLFERGDQKALEAAVLRVLCDPDLAARMGATGRQLVRDQFDTRRMAAAYQNHYLELLGSGRSKHRATAEGREILALD